MKLHCKVVSGYQAGLDKELDRDTVLISRDAKADVQLHPTKDLQVGSQRHVELVRDGDGYIVRCQHANGVTLISDGEETQLGHGQQGRFTGEADLVLGKDGPRVRCIAIDAAVPATVTHMATMERARMPVSEVSSGTVQKAEQSSGTMLKVGAVCVAVALLVGVVSFFAFRSAGNQAKQTISELEDEIEDRDSEHEEDFDALHRAMDERIAEMTAMRETIEAVDAEVRNDFVDTLRGYTQSVASVGIKDSEGRFSPQGTAWVVGDQMLATNAHVVEGLRNLYAQLGGEGAGLRAVARFAREDAREVEIDMGAIKSHPGFGEFIATTSAQMVDIWTQTLARNGPGGQPEYFHLGSAYDVGLLPTKTDAGPPLPLAKEDDLRGLDHGTEIAYIGFPLEGLVGARINNPPEMHIGRLTSLTNLVQEADTFENALILNHSLPIVGGSSGSPIFSRDGKVIGLISHGAMAFVNNVSGVRTRIVMGFNYGQRVTMLREMLVEHPGKDAQRLRTESIQRQLDGLNLVGGDERAIHRADFAARNLLQFLKENDQVTGNLSLNYSGQQAGVDLWPQADASRVFSIDLKPGSYIATCATSGMIDIVLVIEKGGNVLGRLDDSANDSTEAGQFVVPGDANDPAVRYDFTIGRFGETDTDHNLILLVIPLE